MLSCLTIDWLIKAVFSLQTIQTDKQTNKQTIKFKAEITNNNNKKCSIQFRCWKMKSKWMKVKLCRERERKKEKKNIFERIKFLYDIHMVFHFTVMNVILNLKFVCFLGVQRVINVKFLCGWHTWIKMKYLLQKKTNFWNKSKFWLKYYSTEKYFNENFNTFSRFFVSRSTFDSLFSSCNNHFVNRPSTINRFMNNTIAFSL